MVLCLMEMFDNTTVEQQAKSSKYQTLYDYIGFIVLMASLAQNRFLYISKTTQLGLFICIAQ